MSWYLQVLKQYAVFSGRARRKEYWMFFLFNLIIAFVLGFIDVALILASESTGYGPLGWLYSLAVLIPAIAVAIRRLHDTGRSGWWLLIGLIPLLGALVILVFMVLDGEQGENKYGPNPKAGAE